MIERVVVTPQAAAVVEWLRAMHGPLMFHQSGGCCGGSSPMCYPQGEFRTGGEDLHIGDIAGYEFWIWAPQYAYFSNAQLIIDVVPGRGSGFSLEAPEGVRFLTRSRLFDDDEAADLDRQGPPPRGGS